jgi:hypothetical protein
MLSRAAQGVFPRRFIDAGLSLEIIRILFIFIYFYYKQTTIPFPQALSLIINLTFLITNTMKQKRRSQFTMRLDSDIMKKVKILAIEEGKKTNSLIEEALQDLLKKHDIGFQQDQDNTQ